MTLVNEVPENSRVVHYHMTNYVGAFHYSDRSTVLPCSALRSSVSPAACGVHTLFAVNLCGRGQFAIDLLAHLGFKRMVSCSFCDKRMRLKTRAGMGFVRYRMDAAKWVWLSARALDSRTRTALQSTEYTMD